VNPGYEYDVLDWRSFNRDQELEEHPAVTPSSCNPSSLHPLNSRTMPHQRRHSSLSQSLRYGFSELRTLGRRMSLTVRGKNPRNRDEGMEIRRPQLLPFKSDQKMMDLNEAVSSKPRPKSRGWLLRTPSTRRRPSLPLLNFAPEPWQVRETPLDNTVPPRSRGQPFLSDLVYGGAGARAAAAAQNERYHATKTPPLPPYEPHAPKLIRDSESGIGIELEARSRRGSSTNEPYPVYRDPTSVLAIELLESIFSLLDAETLMYSGLVSHKWRSVSQSQAIWRQVFFRKFSANQPVASPYASQLPGLGKKMPGQDFRKLYQVRTLIDKRWDDGQAAAIYLNGHKDSVYCVQFDEHKIITGSRDNTIRVWDAHTYQCLRKLGPYNNPREKLHAEREPVEPQGVRPFFRADISSPDPISPPLPHWHKASVLCLQYDDEILVTGSSDYTCLVWSIKDNYMPLFRLVGHQAGVLDVCIDRDYIITCSKDTTIKLWDRNTGQLVQTLVGHRGPVNAVQVRGNLLASASGDGMSKLWRLEDGVCIKEFQSKDRGLACVEFSEDGRTIFAGGNDQVIYEYDTISGSRVRELRGHRDLVRSLHLDSANSRIISGSYDSSIKVWDAKSGESAEDGGLKINFEGWTSSWMLAAKSNYRKIVCTSQDGRVVIIDFGYGIDGVDLVEA
jgi:F-box and WD-40 domain protein 1/11